MTDEIRNEADKLGGEYRNAETQHRAAIVAEGEDRAAAEGEFGNGDGEPAEVRSLIQRVTIGDYLRPAAAGIGLAGVPAELAGALKVPVAGGSGGIAVPWRVLAGDAPEARQAPESARLHHHGPTTTGRPGNGRSCNGCSGRASSIRWVCGWTPFR